MRVEAVDLQQLSCVLTCGRCPAASLRRYVDAACKCATRSCLCVCEREREREKRNESADSQTEAFSN
jgi:hypothetical protein